MHPPPAILITDVDLFRLRACMDRFGAAEALMEELERANVVPSGQVPENVVTMNSRMEFEDIDTRQRRMVTLVYPKDADPKSGRISVFEPIGASLLGLSVGEVIRWPLPSGRKARLELRCICYQPEAAGDLHL